ncbi:uncharacterized protein MKK02DRAFT_44438 [Dioszegia hungarica]|uniref:Uncharacterized protein n=1 Tax=Dioszegia hungarica TaxID=4972 RepID=A0AA38H7M6_9TREE|nr:uncharacterized protein MKK02DRAFT_44438 [Dioszegia hungarica]KAI9635738.1 hypothetical protein MKK02DRAFT_44438 [Dioszegia hungarica]
MPTSALNPSDGPLNIGLVCGHLARLLGDIQPVDSGDQSADTPVHGTHVSALLLDLAETEITRRLEDAGAAEESVQWPRAMTGAVKEDVDERIEQLVSWTMSDDAAAREWLQHHEQPNWVLAPNSADFEAQSAARQTFLGNIIKSATREAFADAVKRLRAAVTYDYIQALRSVETQFVHNDSTINPLWGSASIHTVGYVARRATGFLIINQWGSIDSTALNAGSEGIEEVHTDDA